MTRIVACIGLSAAVALIGFSLSFAKPNVSEAPVVPSFQVTIRIFAPDHSSPVAEHLVMFDQDTVYSFPNSEHEPVTVISAAAGQIILVDRTSRVHTVIRTDDLLNLTANLRSSANNDALKERLGIDADVQIGSSGIYSVEYGNLQYSTTTQQPADADWAIQFGRFADWAARLNIAQKRGLPPFGRMLMNSRIAADDRIPLETTVQVRQGDQTSRYRSTHDVSSGIGQAGRLQIDQINEILALTKAVPLSEFPIASDAEKK